MKIRSFLALAVLWVQYFLYRWAGFKEPEVPRYYQPGIDGLSDLLGWWRKLRVVDARKCPQAGPAIFASNHILIGDPFVTGNAIYRVTGEGLRLRAMMRDDFFKGVPGWVKWLLDPDEILRLIGGISISREHGEPTQLEPFIDLLCAGGVFLIYPGRTRSRSGLFMEYRDWIRSPGATSRLLAKAQEKCPSVKVAVSPNTRTFNPVTGRSALVFGEPMYLPPDADLTAQRAFDFDLVVAMSNLIEIHVPHVVAGLLYLRCLHGRTPAADLRELCAAADQVFSRLKHPYVDPAAHDSLEAEVKKALRFLQSARMVRVRGQRVELDAAAILAVPASLGIYRKRNAVKYLVNQILHLKDAVACIEEASNVDRMKDETTSHPCS